MFKKVIALVTLLCFILCIGSCYTRRQIPPEQLPKYPKYHISRVITTNNDTVKFDTTKKKRAILKEDRIEGLLEDSTFKSIPLSEVKTIHIRKFNTVKTILVGYGIWTGVALIAWLISGAQINIFED